MAKREAAKQKARLARTLASLFYPNWLLMAWAPMATTLGIGLFVVWVGVLLAGVPSMALARNFISALKSGDLQTATLVVLLAVYATCLTIMMFQIVRLNALHISVTKNERVVQDLVEEVGESRTTVKQLRVEVAQMSKIIGAFLEGKQVLFYPDKPVLWSDLTDTYTAVNGRLLGEVPMTVLASGEIALRPDLVSIKNWSDRFCDPEMKKIELVICASRKGNSTAMHSGRQLLRLLAMLEAVDQQCKETERKPDFSKLSLVFIDSPPQVRAFILSAKRFGATIQPHVFEYVRNLEVGNDPLAAFDTEEVAVRIAPEDVNRYSRAAKHLVFQGREIPIASLRATFGDLVPIGGKGNTPKIAAEEFRAKIDRTYTLAAAADAVFENGSGDVFVRRPKSLSTSVEEQYAAQMVKRG